MPRNNTNLLPLDPVIDRTFRRNLKGSTQSYRGDGGGIHKPIRDYFQPTLLANQPGIMNVPSMSTTLN